MSTITHITTNPTKETPSTSDTALGEKSGANIAPSHTVAEATGDSVPAKASLASNQPGSAEAAAEKLYEKRMEDEYAKPQGGA